MMNFFYKNFIRILLFGIFLVVNSNPDSYCQINTETGSKLELEKIKKDPLYHKAENYLDEEKYKEAIKDYFKLLQIYPNNLDLNYKLGFCYLKDRDSRSKSIPYFKFVINKCLEDKNLQNICNEATYYLGIAYHYDYKFDEALSTFQQLAKNPKSKMFQPGLTRNIQLAISAKDLYSKPTETVISKMGMINTSFDDYSPVFTGDESVIIYTTKNQRGKTNDGRIDTTNLCEDIYILDKNRGFSTEPKAIGSGINTEYHDATCALSIDGQELYIYRSSEKDQGDIYYTKLEGTEWLPPFRLGSPINSDARETHVSLTPNGKTIYFCSDRKGGIGGMDIYVSEKKPDGTWGKAKNLGPIINTPFNEESPYIHPNGNTLYFSSSGHPGMGSLDIFSSVRDSAGNWSKPENMGFPINTVDDDYYFYPSVDGKRAYFSSRQDGQSDIFLANRFKPNEENLSLISGVVINTTINKGIYPKSEIIFKGDTTIIGKRIITQDHSSQDGDGLNVTNREILKDKVIITDSISIVPPRTSIWTIKVNSKRIDNIYMPNSKTGKYQFVLLNDDAYIINYNAPNYIYETRFVELNLPGNFRHARLNASLDSIVIGKVLKKKQLNYTSDTATADNLSELELIILANFLKDNPQLKVDFALEAINNPKQLKTAERIKKATNYLINRGINSNNISKGIINGKSASYALLFTLYDHIPDTIKNNPHVIAKIENLYMFGNTEGLIDPEDDLNGQMGDVKSPVQYSIVNNILFGYNQDVPYSYKENIDTLSHYLKQNTDAVIEIIGHTDAIGDSAYNQELSLKRASKTKQLLLSNGVDTSQVKITGLGMTRPIALEKNDKGELQWLSLLYNRRVEFNVIKEGSKSKLLVEQMKIPQQYQRVSFSPQKFTIELLKTRKILNSDYFKDLVGWERQIKKDRLYSYIYGTFDSGLDADIARLKLIDRFPRAIIIQRSQKKTE